jgi:hypothetical protein
MTVWEVSSLGDIPFADTPNRTLSEIVKSGQRPQAPENCSGRLYQLMMECWDLNPNLRPTFSSIVERIQNMILCKQEDIQSVGDVEESLYNRRHGDTSPDLIENGGSPSGISEQSSTSLPSSPFSVGSLNLRRPRPSVDLEGIPEVHFETDT